ncbi:MAG: Gfo/Idh/MocA family oxidoreductase [Verrucomicrobia bacterium]|nr:Gfo/Idh/MocA family oxidoreductase [Verrucomicrobiota bacterium]MDA1069402.1 Gfo/Idh/MocA family oxidoreductase [Verrucomicrobiota bacterium]
MNRRTFLTAASLSLIASQLPAQTPRSRRAAVIGHTGRGNYGHGLDVVWQKIPGVEIVGVADADSKGLEKALGRLNIRRGFRDYRKMLSELRPEFVSVAPRHPDQHMQMAFAAIENGVKGLYVEKPFCRTPAEADHIINAAIKHGAKVAVAHRNRYHPALPIIDQLIEAGEIGRLLEIRGHGLGDRRGGGEDLWVLGGHIFNLFQRFGGEPESCSGTILQNGKPATREDVVNGAEGLGLLAGNEIHARWRLSSGVTATYTTLANDGSNKSAYAVRLIGTKGSISIHIDRDPIAWHSPGNPFDPASRSKGRIPITSAGLGMEENQPNLIASVHDHTLAIQDLIDAVDEDRNPLCDGRQGAMAVEMTCSVFESHRQNGAWVSFPLTERGNPLSRL